MQGGHVTGVTMEMCCLWATSDDVYYCCTELGGRVGMTRKMPDLSTLLRGPF